MRLSGGSLQMYLYIDCKGEVQNALKYSSGVWVVFSPSLGLALSLVMLTVWISDMSYVVKLSWWQHSIIYYWPDRHVTFKVAKTDLNNLMWLSCWGGLIQPWHVGRYLGHWAADGLTRCLHVIVCLFACLCLLTISFITQATSTVYNVFHTSILVSCNMWEVVLVFIRHSLQSNEKNTLGGGHTHFRLWRWYHWLNCLPQSHEIWYRSS